jgi:hypothetical protein
MVRTLAACCLCLLLAPRPARAGEWHFTPSLGVTFAGSTTLNDLQLGADKKHFNFGGMVSRFGDGVIGVEGIFLYTRHFFEFDGPRDPANAIAPVAIAKSYTMSLSGNVVLTVPKRWTEYFLRPYVSGGFGLLRAVAIDQPSSPGGQSLLPVTANMPAFTIGGGAIGFFSQGTGVRFDLRYHDGLRRDPGSNPLNGLSQDLRLHYMTAEIGVVIRR